MKRYGRDDFWSLSPNPRYLPRETREYVPMILAAVIIARNPAQYRLHVPEPTSAAAAEKVTVAGPVDLRRVAEWTSTPVDVIQQLNPELRRWTTPVRAQAYELKCRPGAPTRCVPAGRVRRGRTRGPQLAHGAARREHRDHRAQAARQPHRSGRGQLPRRCARASAPARSSIIPRAPAVLMAAQPDRPTPVAESRPDVERATMVTETPRAESSSRTARSIASSAATRCRRSRACSRPASRRSSTGTGCARTASAPDSASRSTPPANGSRSSQFLPVPAAHARRSFCAAASASNGASRQIRPENRRAARLSRPLQAGPPAMLASLAIGGAVWPRRHPGRRRGRRHVRAARSRAGRPARCQRPREPRSRAIGHPELGLRVPAARVTVNLAPADVRKAGTAFDLPIALGVLAATGVVTSPTMPTR